MMIAGTVRIIFRLPLEITTIAINRSTTVGRLQKILNQANDFLMNLLKHLSFSSCSTQKKSYIYKKAPVDAN